MAKTIEELEDKILSGDFDEYTLNEYNSAIRLDQRKKDIEKAEQFCIKWFENIIALWLQDLRDEPFHTKAINEVKERLHKAMEDK